MTHVLAGLREGKQMEFTWQVTQADIDNGEREDCFRCAIALSLNRVLPGVVAEVDHEEITLYEPDDEDPADLSGCESFEANMPELGNRFIWDFDEEGPDAVGPITLTVVFTRV